MLAQRIATALVMLAVFVATLMAEGRGPFAWLMLALIAAAAWEWGRLCGVGQMGSLALGGVAAAAMALLFFGRQQGFHLAAVTSSWLWWLASLIWAVGGAWVLRAGVEGWRRWPWSLRLAVGVLILITAWLAITQAASISINFMMSFLMLIWASDIAAYFGGRALGGRVFGSRKLAPSISPGKTWEGAVSGLVGALVLASVWTLWVDRHVPVDGPSLASRLVAAYGWLVMLLAVAGLAAAGIMGDLFESLVKRAAGAKDSSRLLPGHGGVLDRVDALLPVLPMAMALATLTS